jgi:ABC-type polysaccharide/polyol phosphate transport system ATPase subunit
LARLPGTDPGEHGDRPSKCEAPVDLRDVGEKFLIHPYGRIELKEHLLRPLRAQRRGPDVFWALRGVNLTIEAGEVFGVVGENGSGKTTLLKVMAGILAADEGEVRISGRISALLDLGAAFQEDMTGRENLYLYGSILGLRRQQVEEKLEHIVAYSELGEFIDRPLKSYSSGMRMRLGFALAINVDPTILLVDEVFVVGDEAFRQKCLREIEDFKSRGKTIVLVSHDLALIASLCDRAALLKGGRVVTVGPANEVVTLYARSVGEKQGVGLLSRRGTNLVFNNGAARILRNGSELTTGMAVFSNFLSQGIWYPSATHARWRVRQVETSLLSVEGRWSQLPVEQVWTAKLLSERTIRITVETRLLESVELSQWSVGVMLTGSYSRWRTGDAESPFPRSFNEAAGAWQVVWSDRAWVEKVHLLADGSAPSPPPEIAVQCLTPDGMTVSVENSDAHFGGRVVQISRIQRGNSSNRGPDRHSSLTIEIALETTGPGAPTT